MSTKNFQSKLQEQMEQKGWTPLRLAFELETLGSPITLLTIEKYLLGASDPQAKNLRAIADVLGCSMDELYPSDHLVAA